MGWNLRMNQLETAQAMMTETIESNKDLLELNGLWLEKANATWWPVWKKQWETTLLMWEGRNIDWTTQMTEANQWIQKANATWWPVWGTWMSEWDSQFALWEEKYGDKAWWPMWSMWMKEWKNMMTTNKWSTMPANWSQWWTMPAGTWWPSTTFTIITPSWWSTPITPTIPTPIATPSA